ncbi:MAG: pseudouridine synthase [Bacteroidales bacterium]|nr:pseudouridine synthase [Bacteroidales bacterium]
MEGYSKDGRKLRPRKGSSVNRTEKVDIQSYSSNSNNRYGAQQRPHDQRRPYGDRSERPYGERHYGDRPYGDRPYGDRQARGERPYGERQHSDRPYGQKPGGYSHSSLERQWGEHQSSPYKGKKGGKRPAGKPHFSKSSNEGINRMISRRPQVSSEYDGPAYEPVAKDEMRLNRFIANSGVCSRREADTFIQAGCVTVNGEVVTELGTKVNIFNDDVRFNGERLKGETKVYLVMNKPKGYVTSASDPHADKTVMDLIKDCPTRVYPVGRLDKATTGVLMFTNDGEIAERLTHPSYDKKKIYQVALDKNLSQEDYDSILSGITLGDGFVQADALEFVDENDHTKLGIEIHSGKNRIVRRIFESLGYNVKALDRVYFAGLTKKGLKKGGWRYLSEKEVNMLKMGAYV